jgi:nicotinamide riboside kinase
VTRPLRIAVSGSAGTGKTTLGVGLAEQLGIPFLPEGMRRRLESGLDLHHLTRDRHRALFDELFDEKLTAMTEAERTAGGFVVDRSVLDFAAFWLYYGFGHDEDATARLMEAVRQAASRYDLILLLPWGTFPLAADGVRLANPWIQLHFQALLEGLIAPLLPAGLVVPLPASMTAPEARLVWALDQVAHAGSMNGR